MMQVFILSVKKKSKSKKDKLIDTHINVSSKNDGLEITIDKAMYDKKKLYLDRTLKSNKLFRKSKYKDLFGESGYGDGIKVMYISELEMYINNIKLDDYSYSTRIVDVIDENTSTINTVVDNRLINEKEKLHKGIITSVENLDK